MAPLVGQTKIKLSFPLYACDFDPLDPTKLVVGGGGGASKTGIGNNITVLDLSKPRVLANIAQIELSKDEDNPTSLAVGQGHLIFAGINSSPKEVEEGKNRHFRVYEIEETDDAKVKDEADSKSGRFKILEKSRCSLYSTVEKDTYQRVTRLARAFPGDLSQLGAVTTGLAQSHEIILFETAGHSPPLVREKIQIDREAVDIDIIQTDEREFQFAYCDDDAIFIKKISPNKEHNTLKRIYTVPKPKSDQKFKVPCLRAIRWLTKDHLVVLTNLPDKLGVILQILAVPREEIDQCRVIRSSRLPRHLAKATGLCVSNLSPPVKPTDTQDCTQFLIALAGSDRSIRLFTVDTQLENGTVELSAINPFRKFLNVHPLQITSLSFSSLILPVNHEKLRRVPPNLHLASVGIGNTVVVYTLPLFPIISNTQNQCSQGKNIRYAVTLPSRTRAKSLILTIGIIGILLIAIIIQVLLKIDDVKFTNLGVNKFVPLQKQGARGSNPLSAFLKSTQSTQTVGVEINPNKVSLGSNKASSSPIRMAVDQILDKITAREHHDLDGVVVLKEEEDGQLRALLYGHEIYDFNKKNDENTQSDDKLSGDGADMYGKPWVYLSKNQKKIWKARLSDLGKWAEDLPETVFKGILFKELAAVAGAAVRAA